MTSGERILTHLRSMLEHESKMKKLRRKPTPNFNELRKTVVVQTGSDEGSSFFYLPAEVRNMIYQHCASSGTDSDLRVEFTPNRRTEWRTRDITASRVSSHRLKSGLASLISTSKQAYLEGMISLYTNVTFCFDSWKKLNAMLARLGGNGRALVKTLRHTYHLNGSHTDLSDPSESCLMELAPRLNDLTSLRHVMIHMDAGCVSRRTGDDMHPVCQLRGIILEVVRDDHLWDWWTQLSDDAFETFSARMIAHVAQPKAASALKGIGSLGRA